MFYIHFMDIQKILKDDIQFLAVTSLRVEEFEELLVPFTERWQNYFKHYKLRGTRRKTPLTAKQLASGTKKLSGSVEKLFFILYFFKNHHLQQSLSAQFDMKQSQISRWIKALMPILEKSIKDLHLQPARDMDELVRLFRNRQREDNLSNCEPSTSLHLDATEREKTRSTDYETQKHDFSGKQHRHTLKNSVISDESQFIHFAGFTFRGAIHDKAMIEQEIPDLDCLKAYALWFSKDKGYQGYEPSAVQLLDPFKAARNRPLADWQKKFNTIISSIRVTAEHAIGGVKRCKLVSEKLRYRTATFSDQVFNIACGLHNLRATRRKETYAPYAARLRARINLNFQPT